VTLTLVIALPPKTTKSDGPVLPFQQVAQHAGAERTTAYFAQLLSETLVTTYSRGTPVREWRRKKGVRSEVLDWRVYEVGPQAPPKVSYSRWMNA
jgi:phage terminase large subunit GpA-like protein